jgi:hypothetical protein
MSNVQISKNDLCKKSAADKAPRISTKNFPHFDKLATEKPTVSLKTLYLFVMATICTPTLILKQRFFIFFGL